MSSDTYKTNHQGGNSPIILRGKTNFILWFRTFRFEAEVRGLTKWFDGEIVVPSEPIFKPNRLSTTPPPPTLKQDTGDNNKDEVDFGEIAMESSESRGTVEFTDFQQFKYYTKQYERLIKEEREAKKLLFERIDHTFIGIIQNLKTVHEQANALIQICQTSSATTVESLFDRLEKISFRSSRNVQEYVNKHISIQSDIISTGGMCTDDMIKAKLVRGLPSDWDLWKEMYRNTQDTTGPMALVNLIGRLVSYEHTLRENRWSRQHVGQNNHSNYGGYSKQNGQNAPNNNANITANKARRQVYNTVQTKCPKCKKTNHTLDKCYWEHPELAPWNKKENKNPRTAALAATDLEKYHANMLMDPINPGMTSSSHDLENTADWIPQICKIDSLMEGEECDSGMDEEKYQGQNGIQALAAGSFQDSDTWLLDTGANMNICNDKKWLSNFHSFKMTIDTADESTPSLQVTGHGTVNLRLHTTEGRVTDLELHNVAYAPAGRCNLLSFGMLALEKNIEGQFNKKGAVLTKKGKKIAEAEFVDGLYKMKVTKQQNSDSFPHQPIAALIDFNDPVMKMHRRLGHLSFQSMRVLNKVSNGLGLTDEQIRAKLGTVCPVCATTKATVITPRDPATRRAEEPGGMIHVDTWGPYPIPGFDNTIRFLFFKDDATRYTWCERLRPGTSVSQTFIDLHKHIETSEKIKVRNYRFDGEFDTSHIMTFLLQKGIGVELTNPYAHYQNGNAERANRTIRDKAAPMIQEQSITKKITNIIVNTGTEYLREARVPENMWPEAIEYAVWLKNRVPTRALRKNEKKTPWEALFDRKPNFDRERVWGSRAYVTIPHERQGNKLHTPRGWIGYFMGLESEAVYRIWNPEKHRVYKVGVARVDDGEGLDDEQPSPSYRDRVEVQDVDVDTAIENGETDGLMPEDDIDISEGEADQTDEESDVEHATTQEQETTTETLDANWNPSQHTYGSQENNTEDGVFDQEEANGMDQMENTSTLQHLPKTVQSNTQLNEPEYKEPDTHQPETHQPETSNSSTHMNPETTQALVQPTKYGSNPSSYSSPILHTTPQIDAQIDEEETMQPISSEESEAAPLLSRFFYTGLTHAHRSEPTYCPADIKMLAQDQRTQGWRPQVNMAKAEVPFASKIGKLRADASKCRACWIRRSRCDRNITSGKCSNCEETKRDCRDPSEEEKELYTDFSLPPAQPKIHWELCEKPCRQCFVIGRTCRVGSAKGCHRCERHRNRCNWNLEGAVPAGKMHRPEEPKPEKCTRCQSRTLACDGKRPCNHCTTNRRARICMNGPEGQETEKSEKCTPCGSQGSVCNRKRPCGTCTEKKRTCAYNDMGGLVRRWYPLEGETNFNFRSRRVVQDEEGKEEVDTTVCTTCRHRKAGCDGERPCLRCVERYVSPEDSERERIVTRCTYYNQDGTKEGWDLSKYGIGEDGDVVLREDYENVPKDSIKKSKGSKGIPRTVHEDPVEDELEKMVGKYYRLVDVPSRGDQCGRFAILTSLKNQYPTLLPVATSEDIDKAMQDPEYQDFATSSGMTNTSNFSEDQLASFVAYLGRKLWQKQMMLGVVVEGEDRHLTWPSEYRRGDSLVLWIYNNNADKIRGARTGHWMAMKRTSPNDRDAIRTSLNQEEPERNEEYEETDPETDDQEDNQITKRRAVLDDDLDDLDAGNNEDEYQNSENMTIWVERLKNQQQELDQSAELSMSKSRAKLGKFAMMAITGVTDLSKLPDPRNYAQARKAPDAYQFMLAELAEKKSLEINQTFKVVPIPNNRKIILSQFVYSRKLGPDGKIAKYKARLVARGDMQVEGIDYIETFSPVVKTASYRIMFAIAALMGWEIHQMDAVTAFLNGELQIPVYMRPPPGWNLPPGYCLEVWKALYGLCPSPRAWYEKWRKTVERMGFRVSPYDPCVFIHDKRNLYIGLWVDDTQITGSEKAEILQFKEQIAQMFKMTDEGLSTYFLKMHVEQKPGEVFLHQERYAEQVLERYQALQATPVSTPVNTKIILMRNKESQAKQETKHEYMSKIGSINYLANGTRPDIAFAVGYLSRFASDPNQAHMDSVNRLLSYIRLETKIGLKYRKEAGANLRGYADSDWANCKDTRKSTGGWIFMFAGAPISWSSKRQTTVALSTLDAEYIAACEAAREAVWLKGFINDLGIKTIQIDKIPIYIDNEGAYKLTKNPEFHNRSKHIDIKYHYIREKVVDSKEIETFPIGTRDNIADILTKALTKDTHEKMMKKTGLLAGSKYETGTNIAEYGNSLAERMQYAKPSKQTSIAEQIEDKQANKTMSAKKNFPKQDKKNSKSISEKHLQNTEHSSSNTWSRSQNNQNEVNNLNQNQRWASNGVGSVI